MEIKKYDLNLIKTKAKNLRQKFIDECENAYRADINKVVEKIIENKNAKFLLISGPSSAGKTTTSKLIQLGLKKKGIIAHILSIDDFFINRENTPLLPNGEKDYESVNAIDWKLFDECVSALLKNIPIKLPTYNFKSGEKEFITPEKILQDNEFIIIEGLHALNPIIDNFIPKNRCMKLYINVASEIYTDGMKISQEDIRLIRRIIRDIEERGYSPDHTLSIWKNVCDGEKLYIDPFKDLADFKIATFHPYEICVYGYIFSKIDFKNLEYDNFKYILKFLKKCYRIDPDYVPNTSLLQEFIRIKI